MSIIPSQAPAKQSVLQWLRRWRAVVVIAMALISLVATTVAIGQASQNYDLACRGMLLASGHVTSASNFAVIGAMGASIIPPRDSDTAPTYAIRSATYGVRAGFLPAYPNGVTAAAGLQQSAPVRSDQDIVQRLPILYKVGSIIRGGC